MLKQMPCCNILWPAHPFHLSIRSPNNSQFIENHDLYNMLFEIMKDPSVCNEVIIWPIILFTRWDTRIYKAIIMSRYYSSSSVTQVRILFISWVFTDLYSHRCIHLIWITEQNNLADINQRKYRTHSLSL